MQAVHELGHVLAAWVTGAGVEQVVLHPLAFSRTVLGANPRPLAVSWSGPLFGCLAPLVAWLATRAGAPGWSHLPRLFLGFCLIANGLYLGTGPWTRGGDPGDLLALGSPAWLLVAFGAGTSAAGVATWNGLGPAFGFGPEPWPQRRAVAVSATLGLIAVIALEASLSPR